METQHSGSIHFPSSGGFSTVAFPVPPLENGDVMDRHEFERRWEAMPNLHRAELIEGVVFMPASLRYSAHGNPHLLLSTWLGNYVLATPGVEAGDAPSVRLDDKNMPQPDLCLFLPVAAGGNAVIASDDYLEGPPDFVAEVAASSATMDLHTKKEVYERSGVHEYLVWRTLDRAVDWFVLNAGKFVPMPTDECGILKSRRFPGLWLDPRVLVARDRDHLLDALELGLASPEHSAFVQFLARCNNQPPPIQPV